MHYSIIRPRTFIFPSVLPTWHLGHMVRAMRDMKARMRNVDVVIETRDARLPLTSINPAFEELFQSPQAERKDGGPLCPSSRPIRLIVYNKKDLADHHLEKPLSDAFMKHGQKVFFINSRVDQDVKEVLFLSKKLALPRVLSRYGSATIPSGSCGAGSQLTETAQPYSRKMKTLVSPDPTQGIKIMFCGMPNVGKSSLLNALRRVGCRKGKAASEAPMPGHTRSIGGMVRVSDGCKLSAGWPIYAFDTPGIMVPYLGQGAEAADRAFKMAITAGIKDSLFDPYDLAAYLFHSLILRYPTPTEALLKMSEALTLSNTFISTDSLAPSQPLPTEHLLSTVADRIKAIGVGGAPDLEAAARWMLKCFRDGRFGGWTLDDVGQRVLKLNDHDNAEESILRLIKSNSKTDQPVVPGDDSLVSSHRVNNIEGCISNDFESPRTTPKSKTAIKMEVRRARREIQRANNELLLVKRRQRQSRPRR